MQTEHGLFKSRITIHVGESGLENHSKNARKQHLAGFLPLPQLMKLKSITMQHQNKRIPQQTHSTSDPDPVTDKARRREDATSAEKAVL